MKIRLFLQSLIETELIDILIIKKMFIAINK